MVNTEEKISWIMENMKPMMLDAFYPVGSLYWSSQPTSPSLLFGGTWKQITDTFILAAGSTYTAGNTGGQASNSLSASNLPSFTASVSASNAAQTISTTGEDGYHQHAMSDRTIYSAGGSYYATIAYNNGATDSSGTSWGGRHQHSVEIPSMSVTGTASYSGSATAFSNMPPYLVRYCWERTA